MCNHRPLVAVFVVLENSSLVKSGRGQTKLSFGTPSFDVWCLIPEIISKQTPKSSENRQNHCLAPPSGYICGPGNCSFNQKW